MSFYAHLFQSHVAKVAVAQSEPVAAVVAVLLCLWLAILWEGLVQDEKPKARHRRQVQLVEAMYRRKYAGRPLAGLRAWYRCLVALFLLAWRVVPRPIRLMALCTYAAMFGIAAGLPVFMFLLSGVRAIRPREVPAGLSETLDAVDATELIDTLQSYRPTGRQGYPLTALWRAHLSGYLMGLSSTNALIRHLQDDPELRAICGFSELPHRTTFNRFTTRLGSSSGSRRGLLGRADRQAERPAAGPWREGRGRFHDRAVPLESAS